MFVARSARRHLRLALIIAAPFLASGHAGAAPWPPADPAAERTTVVFTAQWSANLRSARSLQDLQNLAGAAGKLAESHLDEETPHLVFVWTSAAPGGGAMRANVYPDGAFGATMTPAGGEPILVNSFGAFFCRQCQPPVAACGGRPSWIPHDLHWDNFDYRCTITGPQSVSDLTC